MRTPDGALHISGEVIECDPPRKLTVTFNVNWPALVEKLGPTLVTYEIEPAGDAVKLTHAAIARPRHQRRHPVRRPRRLARDPLQPEEPAGDRQALAIKMAPPERMLAALKEMGIGTPCKRLSIVVPANAGTHTSHILRTPDAGADNCCLLWVPAPLRNCGTARVDCEGAAPPSAEREWNAAARDIPKA